MRCSLSKSAGERNDSRVELDARHDALRLEQVDEASAVVGALMEGLFEQDDATDVLGDGVGGGEEELAVFAAVVLGVLELDGRETLADGA